MVALRRRTLRNFRKIDIWIDECSADAGILDAALMPVGHFLDMHGLLMIAAVIVHDGLVAAIDCGNGICAVFVLPKWVEGAYTLPYWRNPVRTTPGTVSLLVVGLLATSFPLFAHHGNAAYDTSKNITVMGTVTEYIWANPHVFLKIDAKDESGNTVHWIIESQNVVNQANAGWNSTTFKPGDQVAIDATPVKNGRPIGIVKGRIVINGKEFKPLG